MIENFSHELAFTIELEKISRLLTERIAQAFNSQQAYFFLIDREQASHFNLVVAYPENTIQKIKLTRNQPLCDLAIRSRKPLFN